MVVIYRQRVDAVEKAARKAEREAQRAAMRERHAARKADINARYAGRRADTAAKRDGQRAARAERALFAHFPGLELDDRTITYQGQTWPLAGARADVETTGAIEQRVSGARLLMTGPLALAWRKRTDRRELYLTVEGDGYGFVIPVDPDHGLEARQLAARINAAAGR